MSGQRRLRGKDHPQWSGGRTVIGTGYVGILMPEHPRANCAGDYVLEHILVAEAALGHPIPDGAEVHHVNGDKADNRGANLVICEDRAYHMLIHARMRAYEACGDANWLRCRFCKVYDDPGNMWVSLQAWHRAHHNECSRQYQRRLKRRKQDAAW